MITNTKVGPYISTCYIEAYWGNTSYRGSGFMIGPNAVVTSGHVIYNSSLGGWPTSCKVWPARDGDNNITNHMPSHMKQVVTMSIIMIIKMTREL